MQTTTRKAREEFVSLIAQHSGDTWKNGQRLQAISVFQFAEKLMRYGATLGRIAENQCNGYQTYDFQWNERAEARDAVKEKRIQKKVTELCALFGCVPIFQGDPRGHTLKIACRDGFTNDWGKEGISVPTS
jgi:hypothetical protein